MMQLLISRSRILDNLCRQIDSFFSCSEEEHTMLDIYLDKALERVENAFKVLIISILKTKLGG